MSRRTLISLAVAAFLTGASCKVSQGNGEAKPENTSTKQNPDDQKNNLRQSGTGAPGATTATKPAPSQTPSQPASKTESTH